MLILERQKDESIMIGDNIEVIVVDVRSKGVHDDATHLGITAPRHISVHRQEVYEAILREKAKKRAAARERAANNKAGNNPAGIAGVNNIRADRGSARRVKRTSGIPVPNSKQILPTTRQGYDGKCPLALSKVLLSVPCRPEIRS